MFKSCHEVVENQHSMERWFALRVGSRCEKVVFTAIQNKGFEAFLPCYEARRRWSDRGKSVQFPLFPGYVFCRLDLQRRLPLLTIPGVLHFVGIGRTPVSIDTGEIELIQATMRSGLPTEPWPYIDIGQKIRLTEGPLAGLEGICIAHSKQQRLVVSVTLLRRSIAVTIDREWACPVDPERQAAPPDAALLGSRPTLEISPRP